MDRVPNPGTRGTKPTPRRAPPSGAKMYLAGRGSTWIAAQTRCSMGRKKSSALALAYVHCVGPRPHIAASSWINPEGIRWPPWVGHLSLGLVARIAKRGLRWGIGGDLQGINPGCTDLATSFSETSAPYDYRTNINN